MTNEFLLELAWKAREKATIWKSRHKVGCAIETENGSVVEGWNIDGEWATSIHSEVCAIVHLTELKEKGIKVAIAADVESFTPCGACLDWLYQFCTQDAILITQNKRREITEYRLKDLYPAYPKR